MKLNLKQNSTTENDVCFLSLPEQGSPAVMGWDFPVTVVRTRLRGWKNGLGSNRVGRLVLHALCMVHHPDRAAWHWHGMVREFAH